MSTLKFEWGLDLPTVRQNQASFDFDELIDDVKTTIILHFMDRATRFIFSLTTKTNYALYSKPKIGRNDLLQGIAEGGNVSLLETMAKADVFSVVNSYCVQGAMRGGQVKVIQWLNTKMNSDFVYSPGGGFPPGNALDALMLLRNAVKYSQLDFFDSITKLNHRIFGFSDPQGATPLYQNPKGIFAEVLDSAVESGDLGVFRYLMGKIKEHKYDFPSCWKRGFHHAGLLGKVEIFAYLLSLQSPDLQKSTDVERVIRDTMPTLLRAGDVKIIVLIEERLQGGIPWESWYWKLAAGSGSVDLVKYLLNKTEARFALNLDAFEGAVGTDSIEVLRLLFECDAENKLAMKPMLFELAAESNAFACFKLLRSMGCEWKESYFPKVLQGFTKRRNLDLLRYIVTQIGLFSQTMRSVDELITISVRFAPNFAPFEFLLKSKVLQGSVGTLETAKEAIQAQHKPALLATWERVIPTLK